MSILLHSGLSAPPSPRLDGRGATVASSQTHRDGAALSSDRATRFLAKIDDYLLTLENDAKRRTFLNRAIAEWEFRKERFEMTEGASEVCTDPRNPIHLGDFTLTITGLAARLCALKESVEDRLRPLIGEYHEFLAREGLTDLGSADEHLFDENLTDAQRKWLRHFCWRWSLATHPEE